MELIEEAMQSGARSTRACTELGMSLRSVQRWKLEPDTADQRGGPHTRPSNALSDAERALAVAVATSPQFRESPPSQIVPTLADMGIYVGSESSFYRILKDEKLAAHRGKARAAGEVRGPDEHVAAGPNQVWSWDITYLKSPVRGLYYYLYMVVDIWSRSIVGWAVHEKESCEFATALILEAFLREGVDTEPLVLHSDNAGPMKGATLLATLQNLGIVPSFSRPRVCDDNPYSEALFRTLKYRPEYPGEAFSSLEAAGQWVEWFVGWYNHEHRHSGIRFVTPAQRHSGQEHQILCHRRQVYEEARRKNPNRWSGETRNWDPIAEVILNPSKHKQPVAEVRIAQGA